MCDNIYLKDEIKDQGRMKEEKPSNLIAYAIFANNFDEEKERTNTPTNNDTHDIDIKSEPSCDTPSAVSTDCSYSMDYIDAVAEACEDLLDSIEEDLAELVHPKDEPASSGSVNNRRRAQGRSDPGNIQLAVQAVIEGGMSLGQAAKMYNVVKSTVWFHASKHPKHIRRKPNHELADLIHSKLSEGMSLTEVSRTLNLPKSTVHQHKVRLIKRGLLAPTITLDAFGLLHNESTNNLQVPIGSVQHRLMQAYRGYSVNGMSVRFAAEFFKLPITTLWRYINRRKCAATTQMQRAALANDNAPSVTYTNDSVDIKNACDDDDDDDDTLNKDFIMKYEIEESSLANIEDMDPHGTER